MRKYHETTNVDYRCYCCPGGWTGTGPLSGSDSFCIGTKNATSVTLGLQSANATGKIFHVKNGTSVVPYSVNVFAGAAETSLDGDGSLKTVPTATLDKLGCQDEGKLIPLNVTFDETALKSASPGVPYQDTITVIVAAN